MQCQKAKLFGLLFNKLPTYDKLLGGTPHKSIFTDINPIFIPNFKSTSPLVTPSESISNTLTHYIELFNDLEKKCNFELNKNQELTCFICERGCNV